MKKVVLAAVAATLAISTVAVAPAQAAVPVFTENFESSTNGGFGNFAPSGKVNVTRGSAYAALPGFQGSGAALTNHYAAFGAGVDRPFGGTLLAATIQGAADIVTRYTLTFAAGVIGSNIDSQFLNVSVTQSTGTGGAFNVFNRDITLSGSTNLNDALSQYTFTFDATGPISLSFLGEGERSDGADTLLDNVTLSAAAVPETSTWIMMILGFGIVGSSMRSTRRRAIAKLASN